jgi:hypothetical protein
MKGYRIILFVHIYFLIFTIIFMSLKGKSIFGSEANVALSLISTAQSQEDKGKKLPPAKNYTVTHATSEIKVDGVLNEEAWVNAAVIKLPYEYLPGDNTPAPVETECLITYDDNNLYVAFRAYDKEPEKIRAHLMDRDAIDTFVQDDQVIILIDAFNDERRGFEFRVNPMGVQVDANWSELEGYEDFSWDVIWDSAAQITEEGYMVEIAIPFNQLRFPRTAEKQIWGLIAERHYPRNVRHRIRSIPTDRNKSCLLCQANKLFGFEGITPGHNLEFDPTLTLDQTDIRSDFPTGNMEKGDIDTEPGLTARWGITPNMIFNATLNPDFSQVEADVAQLDVNIRYALYYPEKRPFFLEGADFFLTPLEAVFTRTVADPNWGVKLTGKAGKNAVGFFSTQDSINNLILPSNQQSIATSLDQDVFSSVLRYRRDVGKGSTFGVLYTGRTAEDYSNQVFGFDGFMRLSRTKTMSFQYLHSETQYPQAFALNYHQSAEPFGGNAFTAEFSHNSRNWILAATYEDLSPNFRADYGFIPRVDIRTIDVAAIRILWGEADDWFTRMHFGISVEQTEDRDNTLTDQRIAFFGDYSGPLQSTLDVNYHLIKELFNGVTYDLNYLGIYFDIRPASGLRFMLFSSYSDYIDYSNSRLADRFSLSPLIELGLGQHLNINFRHSLERLTLEGDEIYQANLTQTNVKYHFNVRTFVRVILQYRDVNRNTELYLNPVEPETNSFFTQFLFSYKINPQTVLFLGYSDNHMGLRGIDLTQTDRTFFIKFGYAFIL